MSKSVSSFLSRCVKASIFWMRPYRRAITQALTSEYLVPVIDVPVAGTRVKFVTPTARSIHDPWKLLEGEPETIRWLDGLAANDVLWDIGANIGVYALYAAKARGLRVLAFEPSASSYAAMTRNIEENGMDDKIDAYCIAFNDRTSLDHLHMANTGAGHSMHAFGQNVTVEGEIHEIFRQAVPGYTIDAFCAAFDPPAPRHIKLDVDSIELKILKGATRTLTDHVETVLVEVDGSNKGAGGAEIEACLNAAGLYIDRKFSAAESVRNVLFRKR